MKLVSQGFTSQQAPPPIDLKSTWKLKNDFNETGFTIEHCLNLKPKQI